MSRINVLIVVDALGAATSGNLSNNVYLVDTNKYLGSWNEGQCELYTKCYDGQIINWRVEPIDDGSSVELVKFVGEIIDKKICVPVKDSFGNWAGRVESHGELATYQYNCVLTIDGKEYTFDPFLNVIQKS